MEEAEDDVGNARPGDADTHVERWQCALCKEVLSIFFIFFCCCCFFSTSSIHNYVCVYEYARVHI